MSYGNQAQQVRFSSNVPAPAAPVRMPDVMNELERLHAAAQRALSVADDVCRRLKSVRLERPDSEKADTESAAQTELGSRIRASTDIVEALGDRLGKLLEELEV